MLQILTLGNKDGNCHISKLIESKILYITGVHVYIFETYLSVNLLILNRLLNAKPNQSIIQNN